MKAAILGTTGYTGMVLLRILLEHPQIETILPASSSRAGDPVSEIDPGFAGAAEAGVPGKAGETEAAAGTGKPGAGKLEEAGGKLIDPKKLPSYRPDVVFGALPHLKSAELLKPYLDICPVIDLSADFRIEDAGLFEKAYGAPQPAPELQEKAVYGLCEWYSDKIRSSDLIANPGCYPTATLLPLLPPAAAGLISGKAIINALSGISGAGKKAKANLLYVERSENCNAYAPGKSHRHALEIQKEVAFRSDDLDPLFTPHLVPLKRGMEVTTAVSLNHGVRLTDIDEVFQAAYGNAPFVRLTGDRIPETREVRDSNVCAIGRRIEGETLYLFSVIDNLVKGASGQAVQNMNIRFGFHETAGLRRFGEV
ncbi:MAG: N-acetyl-gamma-glutamyl-phosphate reductase [Spirochaetales bacterium]|nr:N-acetyl-gamma-glutamyl-phosphate reductase [Spirochaetales bacterium]MCF7938105.1 N-acetyl-gamma-glutamyl-phosphate reductase [Spirochaetales bacterium]